MKWSAFLLFAASVFLPHSQWAKTDEKLNLIQIICGDLNDYAEGFDGHPNAITPNLVRLPKRGVRFTQAHCNIPICGPDTLLCAEQKAKSKWSYLDNGRVRIGVDRSRGACIGFFGESQSKRNLLNVYDAGRYLQQSYYGDKDGTNWNGKPWRYNPIQGGNWQNKPARLDSFQLEAGDFQIESTTTPHHWAANRLCEDMVMKQKIRLDGHVAILDFNMKYDGDDHQEARHQEMPALFVDGALKRFFYWKDDKLVEGAPRILGENGKAGKKGLGTGRSSKAWFAYLSEHGKGIGIYTPGTPDFTCYRAAGNGSTGPEGSACSYVAPIRTFTLKKGLTLEYRVHLTLGTLQDIQSRFEALD